MNHFERNNIFSSQEQIKLPQSFAARFERLMNRGYIDVLDYLKMFAPHRISMWESIKKKTGFEYKNVVADIRLPGNIGGYYNLKDTIGINPMYLMYATEAQIASIVVHEGIHAGVYTESEVHDESITETLARKKIEEVYNTQGFAAYENLVSQIQDYFGNHSFQEIVEMIENGDEETFDNFLELIVVKPLLEDEDTRSVTWQAIEKRLKKQWKFIKEMFPRIINSIESRDVNPHEDATMDVRSYKLEGLLEKAANQIIDNPEFLADVFFNATRHITSIVTSTDVIETLQDEGYGYLIDFNKEKILPFIDTFTEINNLHVFNKESLQVEKIKVAFE